MKEDSIEGLYHVQVNEQVSFSDDKMRLKIEFLDGSLKRVIVEPEVSLKDIKNED